MMEAADYFVNIAVKSRPIHASSFHIAFGSVVRDLRGLYHNSYKASHATILWFVAVKLPGVHGASTSVRALF